MAFNKRHIFADHKNWISIEITDDTVWLLNEHNNLIGEVSIETLRAVVKCYDEEFN